jgi:hypothetical protein
MMFNQPVRNCLQTFLPGGTEVYGRLLGLAASIGDMFRLIAKAADRGVPLFGKRLQTQILLGPTVRRVDCGCEGGSLTGGQSSIGQLFFQRGPASAEVFGDRFRYAGNRPFPLVVGMLDDEATRLQRARESQPEDRTQGLLPAPDRYGVDAAPATICPLSNIRYADMMMTLRIGEDNAVYMAFRARFAVGEDSSDEFGMFSAVTVMAPPSQGNFLLHHKGNVFEGLFLAFRKDLAQRAMRTGKLNRKGLGCREGHINAQHAGALGRFRQRLAGWIKPGADAIEVICSDGITGGNA